MTAIVWLKARKLLELLWKTCIKLFSYLNCYHSITSSNFLYFISIPLCWQITILGLFLFIITRKFVQNIVIANLEFHNEIINWKTCMKSFSHHNCHHLITNTNFVNFTIYHLILWDYAILLQVVCITAMINHKFISFSAVQIHVTVYDLSHISLQEKKKFQYKKSFNTVLSRDFKVVS